ncbi:hypothetical protein PUMCH_001301 [Australozyma saopauloensis]|uniref:Dienelactone hydrolase domain-containing protein n=1 Tax=Australozyma saopauloensis TaxID=291208 RepID=A0AAX4H6B6_9ASCO|nr:hypothetical protein PUMCH_001301 [[Candida] saopauloensis]
MASLPAGKCCTITHNHSGTPIGQLETKFGLNTYVTGLENPTDRVLVILTDIFGHKYQNTQLIADQFAKAGKYQVYVPDILHDDPFDASLGMDAFPEWKSRHDFDEISSSVDAYLKELRSSLAPGFLGGVGYCLGAKFVIPNLSENGSFDAGAVAHPSFVDIESVAAIKKPIVISAAESDYIFPPELRHATEAKLAEIGARYQLDLFSGVSHGFACRGDLTQPVVKYAADKAFLDQIQWFSLF